jgi:hypothetical protein
MDDHIQKQMEKQMEDLQKRFDNREGKPEEEPLKAIEPENQKSSFTEMKWKEYRQTFEHIDLSEKEIESIKQVFLDGIWLAMNTFVQIQNMANSPVAQQQLFNDLFINSDPGNRNG